MKKAAPSILIAVILLAITVMAEAQQPKKIPRIGVFSASPLSTNLARIEELRQGLHQLGYVEGKNIVIEWRFAGGETVRLADLAAELLGLKVDLIVAFGPTSTRAAKEATNSIPIVMAQVNDPVGAGFVASLARPGGSITGFSVMAPHLRGSPLDRLNESGPELSHVAVFGTSVEPGNAQSVQESELAARELNIQLHYIDVLDPKEIETAYQNAAQHRSQAVLVLQS